MKCSGFLVSLLATWLALVGCGKPVASKSTTTPTPAPTPEDPLAIRVGAFLPLSGVQGEFGRACEKGMRLAVAQVNARGGVLGHPLHLILRDTQSKIGEAAKAVRELAEKEKVVAVIGEIASERSLEAAPVAVELGLPMISPGSTHADVTKAGPWVFRVCYVDPFPGHVMAKFAKSIEATRAAILFDPSDSYSAGLAESFEQAFTAEGGTIVARETYQPGTMDFSAPLQVIKGRQPEVIFLPAYFSEAAAIIKQARPLGIDMPFLGTDGWESNEFLKIGERAVNNCYFAGHFSADDKSPAAQSFVADYRIMFQSPPAALAALGYDAVGILAQAIVSAGSTDAESIRVALAEVKNFPGVTGNISFDERRNPAKPAIVIRVEDGKFTYLETIYP